MIFEREYNRYSGPVTFFPTIGEFLESGANPGTNSILHKNSMIDVYVVDRQADTTLVFFHAAVNPETTTLPVFIGQRLSDGLDANVLLISEPAIDAGTGIGWYAGNKENELQKWLTKIIGRVHESLNANHLIFFGASAGGFASLYYSFQFPGSLAVVANPQTNFLKYYQDKVNDYLAKCWHGAASMPTCVHDVSSLYNGNFPNAVIYLQNARDDFHIKNHLYPWLEKNHQSNSRWKLFIDDWGPGHAPVPPAILHGILGFAIASSGNWNVVLEDEFFLTSQRIPTVD